MKLAGCRFVTSVALLLVVAGAADAADITVATSSELSSAKTKVNPGDTVWMNGGTYTSAVAPSKSGSESAWITFKAVDGELPIIFRYGQHGPRGHGLVGGGRAAEASLPVRTWRVVLRPWQAELG
jgi:hypothetical protein